MTAIYGARPAGIVCSVTERVDKARATTATERGTISMTRMYKIWAVDPGAVESGLAWFQKPEWFGLAQFSDPVELYRVLTSTRLHPNDVILVEDYSHGGTFTKEAKATLEIVGFIRYTAVNDGYKVVVRHKDKRLSGQGEAAVMMGDSVKALKADPKRKDAFSALAHCITYARENPDGPGV